MADIAQQSAALFDLHLTPEQVAAFDTLHAELIEWNQKMNLTAITEPDAVRVRHFLDSLSLSMALQPSDTSRWLDVGTGAGFPGLVLAIIYPQVAVTLMDSTAKKLKFIDHIAAKLNLSNVRTLHARAEDAGQNKAHRERYTAVVARAVARLPALLEYCLPLTQVGGVFVAMKGTTAFEELDDTGAALRVLGGRVDDVLAVNLPGMDYAHHLIVVSKTKATPRLYPRQAGIPSREPIEEA